MDEVTGFALAPAVGHRVARHDLPPDAHIVPQAVVAQYPEARRAAFVLTQVLGLSYAEAAQVCRCRCRCPIGTVRWRVARARADLVAAVGEERQSASALGS